MFYSVKQNKKLPLDDSKVFSTINEWHEKHKIYERDLVWLKSDDVMWKVMTFILRRSSVGNVMSQFLWWFKLSAFAVAMWKIEFYVEYFIK